MKDIYTYLGYPEEHRTSLSENIQDLKDNMPSLINWFRESSALGWVILFSLSVCSITGIWRLNSLGTFILGGPETASDFLGKVVKTVSSVNTLKDNIPGVPGLLGMLDSFDKKHEGEQDREEETKTPEPEPEPEN